MHKASQDPGGDVRWFVFIPESGRWILPLGFDPETQALPPGATRLFHGNELVWSRPVRPARHLAVVR